MVARFLRGLLIGLGWRTRGSAPARRGRSSGLWPGLLIVPGLLTVGVAGAWLCLWARHGRPAWWRDEGLSPGATENLNASLELGRHATPRGWTAIVIHHSGTASGSAASFDAYHRQRGWRSLGYDFVIGNGTGTPDGWIEAGPRWRNQESGAHAHSDEFNRYGIGICLVGNFNEATPTPAQLRAAHALIAELCRRYHIPRERIFGHGDVREGGGTDCPGKRFPIEEFRSD